jgi:hypothetical protein
MRFGAYTRSRSFIGTAGRAVNGDQAHLANAKHLAQFCAGEGRVKKQLVDYVAKVPRTVA